MKIACIGAGGNYFSRPIRDFAVTADLKGCEISLFDIDFARVEVMAEFGRRMSDQCNSKQTFKVAENLEQAINGADFVLASIGGAGASGCRSTVRW